jgi:hypothetical protein
METQQMIECLLARQEETLARMQEKIDANKKSQPKTNSGQNGDQQGNDTCQAIYW